MRTWDTLVDSSRWTGLYPEEDWLGLKAMAREMPLEARDGSLWFKPQPAFLPRTWMRFTERWRPQNRIDRLDWLRPYLRTGAAWWRPSFDDRDQFEMFAPTQFIAMQDGKDVGTRKRFSENDNAIWFDRDRYIEIVSLDYYRRKEERWTWLTIFLRSRPSHRATSMASANPMDTSTSSSSQAAPTDFKTLLGNTTMR